MSAGWWDLLGLGRKVVFIERVSTTLRRRSTADDDSLRRMSSTDTTLRRRSDADTTLRRISERE